MSDIIDYQITGESFFITTFMQTGQGKARVAFGAPYPGKIIVLDLGEVGGEFMCQRDAFLCAVRGAVSYTHLTLPTN